MTDEQKPGKIYAAIVEIMRQVGAIGKDSKNKDQGYSYRGAEAVYNRVQPLFATHGVFSVPRVIEARHESGKSKSGGPLQWTFLRVEYTFFADDGSNVVVVVSGEGMDSSDKSTSKAMTVAHRCAITQLLNIPYAVEDPEKDSLEPAPPGITLKQLNELKRAWCTKRPADGKTPAQLAVEFGDWVRDATGLALTGADVSDWRKWKQTDLDACMSALEEKSQGD